MEFNKQNILNKVKEARQTTVVMDEGLRAYATKYGFQEKEAIIFKIGEIQSLKNLLSYN